jgi:nucleoside phosphorylase
MNAKDNPALKRLAATLPNSPLTVLAPTNAIVRALAKAANTESRQQVTPRPFLNFSNINANPSCTIVGPAVGAPAAVLVLEPFLQLPQPQIALIGTCGGISGPDIKLEIGDFVIPTGALCEEGTSQHYGGQPSTDIPPDKFQDLLVQKLERYRDQSRSSGQIKLGKIWSTDVPYLEHSGKVERFRTSGAIGVDMEYSAVLQLCRSYKTPFVSVLIVSDIVTGQGQSGLRSQELKHSIEAASLAIIDLASSLATKSQ